MKPREFWVWSTSDGCFTAQKYFAPKWGVQEKAHRLRVEQKWIHVIEYSAYKKLQERVAELETESDALRSKVLIQREELETAQKKIAHLENVINEITNTAQLSNLKLQDKITELEDEFNILESEWYNKAGAAIAQITVLDATIKKLKKDYAELLEQANKLEEALSLAGHLEEPEHFNSDRTYGYLMACEDVIEKAKPILTQFAEWKNKNK